LLAFALVITVVIAYAPAFRAPFIFDDEPSIQKNTTIRQLWPPGLALHPPNGDLAVSGRPVVNYSLAVNYAINRAFDVDQRPDPFGPNKVVSYRILNLVLHLACGFLLFVFVRRTIVDGRFTDEWKSSAGELAAAVAALWLLHPIQTEAVDYVIQRTELLVSVCFLATLYASLRAWDATKRSASIRWRLAAIVACALGMGSKEVMITAPFAVMLYDRAFRLSSWRGLFRPVDDRRWFYPLLVATSLWGAWLIMAGPRSGTVGFHLGLPWYEYFYSQAWAVAHYLRLFLWPNRLTLDYGSAPVRGLVGIPGLVILSAFGLATIAAWTRANQWGWAAFLGTIFFFLLAPSSSFVPIVTEVAAERRIYLALAAVVVFVVIGAELLRRRAATRFAWWSRSGAHPGTWVVAATCLVLGTLTYRRSEAYAKPETLWREVVERSPQNARGYNGVAQVLLHESPPRVTEAVPLLRQAIALDSTQLVSIRSLAAIDVAQQHLNDASALLEREVAIDPDYADGAVRLGMVLVALGEPERAIPYLAHPRLDLLADDDPTGQSLVVLGTTFSALGKWSDATDAYRRALDLAPHVPAVEEFLGDALLRQNRAAESIPPLEDAIQREPASAFGAALLSLAYAEIGRPEAAVTLVVVVARNTSDEPLVYDLAGRAMALAHRPAQAITFFRRALTLDPAYAPAREALSAIEPGSP
jgi:tetratricopeptide (TPR) repeat protein